jgi:nucleoid-associated protein YgaU
MTSSAARAGQPGVFEVRGRPGGLAAAGRPAGIAAGKRASMAGTAADARARVAPGPARLTSRGRAVVAGLAAAAAVFACSLLAAGGAAAASHGSPGAGYGGMHQVVVKPGQTLWSIASATEPTADPQAVVQQIVTANSLPGSTIHAGQVLWVPRG